MVKTLKYTLTLSISILISDIAISGINFNDRIEQYQLNNGLKIILINDDRSSTVMSSIWYKVGSSYEYEGVTGISHVLEHMMFKGTENTKPGEFSREIKKIGGTENAFTGKDFTGYYQKVHKDYIELCLKFESDRMTNLNLSKNDLKSEREVVKEERRLRTDDNPTAKIFEKISNQAFGMRGYGVPIVGTMKDLNKISVTDLKKWYLNYYAPNNAVLILAGDFNVIPKEIDVHNPESWTNDALFHEDTLKKFWSMMNLGLTDAYRSINGDKVEYTFFDYKRKTNFENNKGLRIDHFLLPPSMVDKLDKCYIDSKLRGLEKPSDHVPIVCEFKF